MHSHHSHSGEYVAHAKDTLEDVTSRAIELRFDVFCLTEHMPRLHYLYPEELERNYDVAKLRQVFDNYYNHAIRLQQEHLANGSQTKFLVGTELEGDDEHVNYVLAIKKRYDLDLIVGSVHFVNEIPIDFDRELFLNAKRTCGDGSVHDLFKEYFEIQYLMLQKVKPEIVGHFDLIRLFLSEEDIDHVTGKKVIELDLLKDWPDIWSLVIRNLEFIKSYGGLIELNSAAIRKGWNSPYPKLDICKAIIEHCDARFCLSDDSHGISQVGLNYKKVLKFVEDELNLKELWYLDLQYVDGKKSIVKKTISIEDVKNSRFFKNIL